MSSPQRFVVVGVLAGAYRGGRAALDVCLTHVLLLDEAGRVLRAACGRRTDTLADDDRPVGEAPSCPRCAARYARLTAAGGDGAPR